MNPVFFNFDAATAGTLPGGFVAISAAPIVVTTAGAISGANALGENSPSGGNDTVLFPVASSPNQSLQLDFVAVGTAGSSSVFTVPGLVLRSDSGYNNCYCFLFDNNTNLSFYKRVSGSYQGISEAPALLSLTPGSRYTVRAEANGTTLSFWIWAYGTSQPGSPSASITDSSIATGNYYGIRFGGVSETSAISADDVYFGNPGATFAGGFIASTLSTTGNTSTTATLSWTAAAQSATGSPSYQLQISPHNANSWSNVSGATSSPATATGLSGSTTYDFRVVASDGINSPVGSNTISVTMGSSNSLAISPTSLSASALQYPVQLNPSGYNYGGTAPTVTLTGGTGASCSYCSTTGLAIICPGTASGPITVSDGTASTTLTVNASSAVSVAPNNSSLAYYGAWNVQSTDATTINSGGTIEFGWQGADSCKFGLDLTGLDYPPELLFELDGAFLARWTTAEVLANPTFTLTPTYTSATNPACYAHRVKVWIEGVYEGIDSGGTQASIDQWDSQLAACKVLGVELPSGGTLLATPTDPNQIEFLGDSITASVRCLYTGSGASNQTVMASHIAWPQIVADALGLKPVVRGFGGTGITHGGSGSVPQLSLSFPYIYAGVAYTPAYQPAVVVLYEGTNDVSGITQAQWQTVLTQIRAARPNALIFAVVPYARLTYDSNLAAAVTAQADANLFYLNYNSGVYGTEDVATDGVHPNPGGHAKLGSRLASDIQAQLTASGVKLQAATGGTYPTTAQVLSGVGFGPTDNLIGTVVLPTASQVISTATFGASSGIAGTVVLPAVGHVQSGITYGPGSDLTGTLPNGTYPTAAQVLAGVGFGPTDNLIGNVVLPTASQVISTATFGASSGTAGTVVLPNVSQVEAGVTYGPGSDLTGTLPNGTYPTAAQVLAGVGFGPTDNLIGTVVLPTAGQVESGIAFGPGSGTTGTYLGSGVYPAPATVLVGTTYGPTSNETGMVVLPTVAQVEAGATFGPGSNLTGTYNVSGVYPPPASVLLDTTYGPTSNETGTLVLPTTGQVQFGATFGPSSSLTGTYVGSVIGSGSGATIEQITELLASGVILASNGLDQVEVEPGINARQALSPILAASAGLVSGADTGNVVLKGGNSSTTRITATTDTYGNRSSVTLSLPS